MSERYQDVIVRGEVVEKGVRECASRWNAIKPYVRSHDVVLDVGSAEGYFSLQIARMFPDSLVVSFESEPELCKIQASICKDEGLYNHIVCNHRLSYEDIQKWHSCVECFDLVLALSVLHHYEHGTVSSVYGMLSEMSFLTISEVTAQGEAEACGGDAKEEARHIVSSYGMKIGDAPSHLGDYVRSIYLGRNPVRVRADLDSWIGIPHEGRNKHTLERTTLDGWHGDWVLNDKHITKGLNAWNILGFNVVWPERKWWVNQAISAYHSLDFKSDARLWNLIVTSSGVKAIDYMTSFPPESEASYHDRDLDNMVETITEKTRGNIS